MFLPLISGKQSSSCGCEGNAMYVKLISCDGHKFAEKDTNQVNFQSFMEFHKNNSSCSIENDLNQIGKPSRSHPLWRLKLPSNTSWLAAYGMCWN